MHKSVEELLDEARYFNQLVGTREFYVSSGDIMEIGRYVLDHTTIPYLAMNRPHTGPRHFIHRIEWMGLKFISLSYHRISIG
jgi:hypothetical protein